VDQAVEPEQQLRKLQELQQQTSSLLAAAAELANQGVFQTFRKFHAALEDAYAQSSVIEMMIAYLHPQGWCATAVSHHVLHHVIG
jgi:hypothetical protein